jgi:hypothetical protein
LASRSTIAKEVNRLQFIDLNLSLVSVSTVSPLGAALRKVNQHAIGHSIRTIPLSHPQF